MANLWSFFRRGHPESEKRSGFDDWANDKLTLGGSIYPLAGLSLGSTVENVDNNFSGYVSGAYKSNGVVFATILSRLLLFTEARFQFQDMSGGRPGKLFGTSELSVLENPWPNGTTGELLARMEQDVSLAGNFYAVREGKRIRRLRPDWVSIILSAPPDQAVAADVLGYQYRPGGFAGRGATKEYLPHEVAHWSPIPDPDALYRGMSWLTPVLREISSDKAATIHKNRFFDNAATPNMVVSFKEGVTEEQFDAFVEDLQAAHAGAGNAYKTMFLAGGADVRVTGSSFEQMDFKSVQGAGETRIAAAGGVPPIIVGLSEGLSASTYSNYGMARRKFGDHWARPQWRSACAAIAALVDVPVGARLWFDDRDIAFLREDQKDVAQINATQAQSIRSLLEVGFSPDGAVAAIAPEWVGLLEHSGLFSVQLMPPSVAEALPEPVPEDKPTPDDSGDGEDDGTTEEEAA